MPQGDLNVANQSGAAFRADLNNQLLALGTMQSGAAEPTPSYAYQLWADTANGLLKQRNGANNAWLTIGTLDTANWGLLTTATASGSYLQLSGGVLTGNLGLSVSAGDGTNCRINIRSNIGPGSIGVPNGALGISSGSAGGTTDTALALGTVADAGGAQGYAWMSVSRASDNNYDTGFYPKYFQFRYGSAEVYRIDYLRRFNLLAADYAANANAARLTVHGAGSNDYNAIMLSGSSTADGTDKGGIITNAPRSASGQPTTLLGGWVDLNGRYAYIGGGWGGYGACTWTGIYAKTQGEASSGSLRLYVERRVGDYNEASPPGSEVGYGVAAVLKGDAYIAPTYTARWTTLGAELQSGGLAALLSLWSDTSWGGGNNYDVYYGDDWGSSGRCSAGHYFVTSSNADGTGKVVGFRIVGEDQRYFRAFGPGYGEIPAFFCRAWVFTDAGTGIRASGNVSSIGEPQSYQKTVNFATAMPDANYSPQITCYAEGSSGGNGMLYGTVASQSSGSFTANFADDPSFNTVGAIAVAVFR